jgi:hypothetical protein
VPTVRHFFSPLNPWLDRLPDSRVPEDGTDATRFLAWWGLALYRLPRGSRRQRDFDLRDGGSQVLAHLHRLVETEPTTLPVHDSLDHFLGPAAVDGWLRLRRQLVQRLLRLKALDAARLLGRLVLVLDAPGLIGCHRRHGPYCLRQRHGQQTL